MKILLLIALLLAFWVGANAQAETVNTKSPAAHDLLVKFIGTWHGEGKIAGADSKIVMKWEPALGGKFFKLIFRNRMAGKDGAVSIFEGEAFYKVLDDKTYQGTWADSGGELHPINAKLENNAVNSLWGREDAKLGRTVYKLVADKKMEVTDSIRLADGTWREFGKAVYVKQ